MITFKTGDLFADDAQCFVNAVNCVGTMGRGVALGFKQNYPEYYQHYLTQCGNNLLVAGDVDMTDFVLLQVNNTPIFLVKENYPECIISFATKTHWRDKSNIKDIEEGLKNLRAIVEYNSFYSLAMPALGCGLGGLSWSDVQPLIEQQLSGVDCDIRVYLPQ